LKQEDYRKLVGLYAELGCNILRVWGGAFLEKEWFYDLCDELGLLVWQEFPLSSSGHENWPHEDEPSIQALLVIAESYLVRRQHHASLLMWCGGNELQGALDGSKTGGGKPVGLDHPLMKRWQALVEREDPGRRFVPSSSSGPRFMADEKDFGKGLHWDVHGPWKVPGATPEEWETHWKNDDALFRSETGVPGTSSAEIIRRYAGDLKVTPGTMENPLWRRFSFWIEWPDFITEKGREPETLEEYVEWSQARQALGLSLAIRASKARFPGIGGIILWMGHDSFPCAANTSIIDFHARPKPAALAASRIWKTPVEKLRPE
jgi:beta-mannosidase